MFAIYIINFTLLGFIKFSFLNVITVLSVLHLSNNFKNSEPLNKI